MAQIMSVVSHQILTNVLYKASLIDIFVYFDLSSATDEGSSQSVPSPASSSISCPDPDQIVSGSYQTNKSEEGKPKMSSAASPAPFDSEEAAIKVIFATLLFNTFCKLTGAQNPFFGCTCGEFLFHCVSSMRFDNSN